MNARGKPLTEFEIFKSALDKKMRKFDVSEMSKTDSKSFVVKLDGKWLDLFFSLSESRFDELFLSFFIRTIEVSALIGSDERDLFRKLELKRGQFSFDFYSKFITPSLLSSIGKMLDALSSKWISGGRFLPKNSMFDERQDFMTIVSGGGPNYTQSVIVYAFLWYLASGQNVDGLSKWIRVVSNAAQNIFYHNEAVYLPSLKFVHSVLPQASDIEGYLSKQPVIKTSNEEIWEEERQKAKLLIRDESWRVLIERAEKYSEFAKGQIGFLLKLSDINPNEIDAWTDDINKQKQELFFDYLKKTEAIFGKNGLIHKRETADLFRRALLIFGDYLLKKSSNHSFLIHTDQRDISFKALLRSNRIGIVKEFFKLLDSKKDFVAQMQAMVDTIKLADDWSQWFIKHPQIIGQHCGQHNIRYNSSTDIIVLAKERMNADWYEYYTTALYYEILGRLHPDTKAHLTPNSGDIWYFSFELKKEAKRLYIAYNRGKGNWRLSNKKHPKEKEGIIDWLSDMDAVKQHLVDNAWIV